MLLSTASRLACLTTDDALWWALLTLAVIRSALEG